MRFKELTKEQQEGRIHCIESMFIDEYADREKRQNIIYPNI
ncbi:Uncharacterised protein [Clostridium carnis]|uniref:Uncharacterized protein n=1 Tax=Clostridium carnis TaxID=1530 RepID=A0ABY6SUA3_9CLOT|nr:hypothetical protein [Clostridium carnis]VDG72168.1 Uncharacterised protein [Clostridium carnis]